MSSKQLEQLVKMANQIALNTGAHTNAGDYARRTGEHIQKFWTRAMQEKLTAHWREGGDGLEPVVVQALGEI